MVRASELHYNAIMPKFKITKLLRYSIQIGILICSLHLNAETDLQHIQTIEAQSLKFFSLKISEIDKAQIGYSKKSIAFAILRELSVISTSEKADNKIDLNTEPKLQKYYSLESFVLELKPNKKIQKLYTNYLAQSWQNELSQLFASKNPNTEFVKSAIKMDLRNANQMQITASKVQVHLDEEIDIESFAHQLHPSFVSDLFLLPQLFTQELSSTNKTIEVRILMNSYRNSGDALLVPKRKGKIYLRLEQAKNLTPDSEKIVSAEFSLKPTDAFLYSPNISFVFPSTDNKLQFFRSNFGDANRSVMHFWNMNLANPSQLKIELEESQALQRQVFRSANSCNKNF